MVSRKVAIIMRNTFSKRHKALESCGSYPGFVLVTPNSVKADVIKADPFGESKHSLIVVIEGRFHSTEIGGGKNSLGDTQNKQAR